MSNDPQVMQKVWSSRVQLVGVDIEGNERTKGWVIRRAARPVYAARTTGRLLHELEGTKQRLQALGIFESVEIFVDTFDEPANHPGDEPERLVLRISVTEKGCITLNTGADINAENSEGSAHASYGLRNYFGSAERIDLRTSMGTASSNNFTLNCHQPTVLDTDVDLRGSASRAATRNPSSSYDLTETAASVSLDFPAMLMATPGSLTAELSLREMSAAQYASATIREHTKLPLGHHTKASLTASLNHDNRDSPMAPTAGWSGNVSVSGSLCDYVASKHFVKPTASLQVNRTLPLLGLTLSSSLHCGGIFMPLAQGRNVGYIRVCDRFFLGSERVRGFQNQGLGPRDEHTAVPRTKVDSGNSGGDDNDWTSMWGDALGGDLYSSGLIAVSGLLPQRKLASFGVRWHVFANCGTLVRPLRSRRLCDSLFLPEPGGDSNLHRLSGSGQQRLRVATRQGHHAETASWSTTHLCACARALLVRLERVSFCRPR